LSSYRYPSALHSFPTRRSSDLFGLIWIEAQVEAGIKPALAMGVLINDSCRRHFIRGRFNGDWRPLHALPAIGQNPAFHYYAYYRSEEHTSELQSRENLVCRLLL